MHSGRELTGLWRVGPARRTLAGSRIDTRYRYWNRGPLTLAKEICVVKQFSKPAGKGNFSFDHDGRLKV